MTEYEKSDTTIRNGKVEESVAITMETSHDEDHNHNGVADAGLSRSNLPSGRLPPLESLEVPKAHKQRSKSPRLAHHSKPLKEPNIDNGDEEATSPSTPGQKKRRSKSRPTSAEGENSQPTTSFGPVSTESKNLQLASAEDGGSRPESTKYRPTSAESAKYRPSSAEKIKSVGNITRKSSSKDHQDRSQTLEKSKTNSAYIDDTAQDGASSSNASDRNRHPNGDSTSRSADIPENEHVLRVEVDLEHPHNSDEIVDSAKLPLRVRSVSNLRTYESGGADEEVDRIEIVSEPIDDPRVHYSKSPGQSILKQPNDITAMFQAGSRPTSANSVGKHSVRIADEVTYSTNKLPNNRKSRPKSAASRPGSATKKPPSKTSNGVSRHSHPTANANAPHGSQHQQAKLKKTTQRKISPHMKTSIFTLMACGIFAGAAALYFSFKTKQFLKEGDEAQAAKNSWYSKLFNIIGIFSGLFILIVVVVYYNINKYTGTLL